MAAIIAGDEGVQSKMFGKWEWGGELRRTGEVEREGCSRGRVHQGAAPYGAESMG